MFLSCGLGHRWISTLPGLHKDVASHNYGISSRSRVHSPGSAPCIPSHKLPPYTPIMHHSPCLHDIQASLQTVLHGISSPVSQPTHCATTNTHSYIDPLSNPVILHSFHMAEPLENTFINLFVYTLHHPAQLPCAFGTLSILLIPSRPLRLPICTTLILDLSFSLHCLTIIRKERHQQ